ncbi:MAG TPA: hypothetical protein VGI43_04405 [Mucilaginibacter sp.]|jgi:hypothetical protein
MTILKITVEDEQADLLRKLLQEVSFVKSIEEEPSVSTEPGKDESVLERIKKIQQEIGSKNLFKDIKDPVEWQREIRKEWDRDF